MTDSKVKPALVRDRNLALVEWYATQHAITVPEVYRRGAALLINLEALASVPTQEARP